VVSSALQALSNTSPGLGTACFHICENGRHRLSVDLFQLEFQSTGTEPGEQDIQVAHFAEQPRQPLQFTFDSFTPSLFDDLRQCTKLAPQPAGG
jgi:hypothetical protein